MLDWRMAMGAHTAMGRRGHEGVRRALFGLELDWFLAWHSYESTQHITKCSCEVVVDLLYNVYATQPIGWHVRGSRKAKLHVPRVGKG